MKRPLIGANRTHRCDRCGHRAFVEAIFDHPLGGKGYYYWPPTPICPYCQIPLRDISNEKITP